MLSAWSERLNTVAMLWWWLLVSVAVQHYFQVLSKINTVDSSTEQALPHMTVPKSMTASQVDALLIHAILHCFNIVARSH